MFITLFLVVCDTAKVRFFKQITTAYFLEYTTHQLFAILQKYDFSSKSQLWWWYFCNLLVVCDTAKVRFFKQITTPPVGEPLYTCCLRYCKSTIFQANHNCCFCLCYWNSVVCDTAKVRFFKQITTKLQFLFSPCLLFAILQKYDFSSKSQLPCGKCVACLSCLRYCKSTIFQANHNLSPWLAVEVLVVCDTAKVRFFKQITTAFKPTLPFHLLFAILQKYDFSSKSQPSIVNYPRGGVVCDTAKVRFFKQITTIAA